jgi:hypothetical protein
MGYWEWKIEQMNRTRKLEPKKRRGSDGLWESWAASEFAEGTAKMAIATGGFEETVPAASTSTTNVQSNTGGVPTAPQHPSWSLPSKKPQFAHAATAAGELKKCSYVAGAGVLDSLYRPGNS